LRQDIARRADYQLISSFGDRTKRSVANQGSALWPSGEFLGSGIEGIDYHDEDLAAFTEAERSAERRIFFGMDCRERVRCMHSRRAPSSCGRLAGSTGSLLPRLAFSRNSLRVFVS
jgi:hypothetical protein